MKKKILARSKLNSFESIISKVIQKWNISEKDYIFINEVVDMIN